MWSKRQGYPSMNQLHFCVFVRPLIPSVKISTNNSLHSSFQSFPHTFLHPISVTYITRKWKEIRAFYILSYGFLFFCWLFKGVLYATYATNMHLRLGKPGQYIRHTSRSNTLISQFLKRYYRYWSVDMLINSRNSIW